MTMRFKSVAVAALVLAAGAVIVLHGRARAYQFHYENVLGTSMDMTVVAASKEVAGTVAAAVLDRIDRDKAADIFVIIGQRSHGWLCDGNHGGRWRCGLLLPFTTTCNQYRKRDR
jgi:hypothetical protein